MVEQDDDERLDRATSLVIVGAGEAALHLLERLDPRTLSETVVVGGEEGEIPRRGKGGPRGGFLARSDDRVERLGMRAQASRITTRMVCTTPDSTKLERWIASRRPEDKVFDHEPALVSAVENFVASPTLEAAGKFFAARARKFTKRGGARLLHDKVKSIRVAQVARPSPDTPDSVLAPAGSDPSPLLEVALAGGGEITTRHLVFADTGTCFGRPNVPPFLGRVPRASATLYPDTEASDAWREAMAMAETDLDLRSLAPPHTAPPPAICIVGGGMTAVHLAGAALTTAKAKHVYLICKGKLDGVSEFGFQVGWMGSKLMKEYREKPPGERLTQLRRQRAEVRGSLSKQARATLKALQASHANFHLLTETTIDTAAYDGDSRKWSLHLGGQSKDKVVSCDLMWIATGKSLDFRSEPFCADLQKISRTPVHGPYPMLREEDLSWPGIPNVMFMGAAASLCLGPTASHSPGFRAAAEKIAEAIRKPAEMHAISTPKCGECGNRSESADALLCEGEGPWEEDWECTQAVKPTLIPVSEIQRKLVLLSTTQKEKVGIDNYLWSDSAFQIEIYFKVDEVLNKESVWVVIGEQELEILAETAERVHHIHLPKLYKPVQVKKSTHRVIEKKGKIVVKLQKCDNHEWKFLKG